MREELRIRRLPVSITIVIVIEKFSVYLDSKYASQSRTQKWQQALIVKDVFFSG